MGTSELVVRPRRRPGTTWLAVPAAALLAFAASSCCCVSGGDPTQASGGQTAWLPGTRAHLPPPAPPAPVSDARVWRPPRFPPAPGPRGVRPEPILFPALSTVAPGDSQDVLVFFADPLDMPRFPIRSDSSDLGARRKIAEHLADSLAAARDSAYAAQELAIAALGGRTLERFWITQCLLARMPGSGLAALAALAGVEAVLPRAVPAHLPQSDPLEGLDVAAHGHGAVMGRTGFGAYWDAGLGNVGVALFDTGVRWRHSLLAGSGRLECLDCYHDTARCLGMRGPGLPPHPAHLDDAEAYGHGTSSASILVGDGTLGARDFDAALRGALSSRVLSYRVWDLADTGATLRVDVLERAMQDALVRLPGVALVQTDLREQQPGRKIVLRLAGRLHEAGVCVVAPVGNSRPDLAAPGSGAGVIAAGCLYLVPPDVGPRDGDHARGTTPDGRIKPDVEAWTGSIGAIPDPAAGEVPDETVSYFGGTSGAAPFVAGAAALLREWLESTGDRPGPGTVNAFLILAGRHVPHLAGDDGAGLIELPTDGLASWGVLEMSACRQVEIPLRLDGTGARRIEAALWWRRPAGQTGPAGAALEILDPGGQPRATSVLPGAFQRATATASAGTWRLRVTSGCLGDTRLRVFWAAALRR